MSGPQRQIEPLAKAREELGEAPPSRLSAELDKQPRAVTQPGDGNRQYNNFGNGTINNFDGHYFEAKGDQNFGMTPSTFPVCNEREPNLGAHQ